MNNYDVIILGGGAAGLMCAIAAGQRGRRCLVLEASNRVGKKILMSGGGRCNFTNLHCDPTHFISANPNFCISALSRYTQWDFISLVEQHGISYHEKTQGQLFCDETAKDIVAMLEAECAQAGVEIRTDAAITAVARNKCFEVVSNDTTFSSESLVLATGGLSIPKMGASDFGYRLARQFGIALRETRAGLVPFMFTGGVKDLTGRLSGLSVPARVSTASGEVGFTESILFTHRGLSGPAALQLSSYWQAGDGIVVDLLPGTDAEELLLAAKETQPRAQLRSVIAERLPRALVLELQALWWPEVADLRLAEIPADILRGVAGHLNAWNLKPAATEGYRTAEVTLGGIDTDELSSRTMESKRVPGLYCIGEVVDVTGHLGGFNFQWAWSSAQAAGNVA